VSFSTREALPTTFEAMKQTLFYTMMDWKSQSQRHLCCPMHCNAQDAMDAVVAIMNERCWPLFDQAEHEWQCATCGTMDINARRRKGGCNVCNDIRERVRGRPITNTVPVGSGPQPSSLGKVSL
jgi:hypothetical protein